MKLRINVQNVPLESVYPNGWNPNQQSDFIFEKELLSIETHGFLDPILVREKDGRFEIIDGEHRWKAATKLGSSEIAVNNLGEVSDQDAKQLTILMNEIRGRADSGLLSNLLKDLEQTMSLEGLQTALPFTKVEIENYLATANIDFAALSARESASKEEPASEPFRTVSFVLPESVADQLEAQVDRFKRALGSPGENVRKASHVKPVECMVQHLAQIPDNQLV